MPHTPTWKINTVTWQHSLDKYIYIYIYIYIYWSTITNILFFLESNALFYFQHILKGGFLQSDPSTLPISAWNLLIILRVIVQANKKKGLLSAIN